MSADNVPSDVVIDNVLVPLDGSAFALAALSTASVLAERFTAELQTISVAAKEGDSDNLVRLAAGALGVEVGDPRAAVVVGDDPAAVIAERAASLDRCVVCLSTHGRGRLTGSVIGSVARSLVQRSSEPLVALGPSAERSGWLTSPNWPAPLSVPRMLACVDGSAESEEVLPVASAWARALGMSMTIVTVVEDLPSAVRPPAAGRYGAGDNPHTYVEDLVQLWQSTAPDVTGEVIRDPLDPASGLREYQDQHGVGLVALTTHARSGVQRVLFGAAAAKIVHASLAPCLVVPLRHTTQQLE